MNNNFNQVTCEQVIELASGLDDQSRFKVVMKLIPSLRSWQIENMLEQAEQILIEVIEEEDRVLEGYARFKYKEISNNFYAYIEEWGELTHCNLYIGPMRFMPQITYRLTHKRTKEVKTLTGLGLYREGEQVFLKLQYLTPVYEERSYLFYDRNLPFPRRPQEDNIGQIFAKKDWYIESLGTVKLENEDLDGSRPKASLISTGKLKVEKSAIVEVQQHSESVEIPVGSVAATRDRKPTLLSVKRAGSTQSPSLPNRKLQPVVHVQRNFAGQVKKYMNQWAALSQALPSNPQWELVEQSTSYSLRNTSGEVIVEYNSNSQTLTAPAVRPLLSWLQEIMFGVSNSKLVNRQQQLVANKLLAYLQSAPLEDDKKLLLYLFNL